MMNQDVQSILLSEEQLQQIVRGLGQKISEDYKDKNLMMVGVLKGSFIFIADLMRAVTVPCCVDFMAVSSYGSGVRTSGEVKIVKDLDKTVQGYDLLVVEDILDSGMTLSYLLENLQSRKPNSVRLCTLLDKPDRRQREVHVDYRGAVIPDEFVVGYGLDYDQRYRNLPYVGILKPEVYGG